MQRHVPRLASRTTRPGAIRPGGFACRGCQERPFSHSLPARAERSWKIANLFPTRRLVSVAGPDAARFLQGALTVDVTKLGSPDRRFTSIPGLGAGGTYGAFLSAQGRVLYDVFVYRDTLGAGAAAGVDKPSPEDSFLMDVDEGLCRPLVEHIERYKLRAKFKTRLAGEYDLYHAWEDKTPQHPADGSSVGLAERLKELFARGPAITLLDARAPNHGYRVIMETSNMPLERNFHNAVETEYCQRRHLHGVAEGRAEILYEKALPQESNLDCMGAIDWGKGCYVGQELTIRTKHRGVVRKRILPCVLYLEGDAIPRTLEAHPKSPSIDAQTIATGTSIEPLNKSGRSAGRWLHGMGNMGLALCRLETMTDVVLPGATTASSYSPEDEFTMRMMYQNEERTVRVKAFVPDWLRACINA